MTVTTKDDIVDPQILTDSVLGYIRGKKAFIGSMLAVSGAVLIEGTMPERGERAIGTAIDVPYFGNIGGFSDNPDGSSVATKKLSMVKETATVSRSSLATDTTRWAQGLAAVDPGLSDPYDEGARQVMEQAQIEMDRKIILAASGTPLVKDVYNASVPVFLDHSLAVRSRAKWGDEQDGTVAMIVHSQTEADLADLKDSSGRSLLLSDQNSGGNGGVNRFAGIPLVISDRVPLTGSTMGAVTKTGTTPPTVVLGGEPNGAHELVIDVDSSTATTITFRFSVDGGNTFSAQLVATEAVAIDLTDTSVDSLIGNSDGETGITATFPNATYNVDNKYTATANVKATSLIVQKGALAFWYNQSALAFKYDEDILADSDVLASHLYHAAHLYRRRRGGSRPGVIAIKHNIRSFNG